MYHEQTSQQSHLGH